MTRADWQKTEPQRPPPGLTPALQFHHLTFTYPTGDRPALTDVSLTVPQGRRTLLLGPNGSGKSTLLALAAGRSLVPQETVRVFGRPAFHDTALIYEVSHIGGRFEFDVDIPVATILAGHKAPAERIDRLCAILEVDRSWHMHRVSDGQRRRVQILLGLLGRVGLLLLDEVTADLDLIARARLLDFIAEESADSHLTVLHATHILDGLEAWATHLVYLEEGRVVHDSEIDTFAPIGPSGARRPLYPIVRGWMERPGANADQSKSNPAT